MCEELSQLGSSGWCLSAEDAYVTGVNGMAPVPNRDEAEAAGITLRTEHRMRSLAKPVSKNLSNGGVPLAEFWGKTQRKALV